MNASGPFTQHQSLLPYNSFRMAVEARYFARFTDMEHLQAQLEAYHHELQGFPLFILGGGSNVLFTGNYNGLVLKNELKGITLVKEDADHYYIQAMGGESWHGFVSHCVEQGYGGVENMSLIPGNVGASPMQNIGAYGVEIKDVFHSLEAWHIQDQCMHTFHLEDCAFGYRESVFKGKYKGQFIITSVTYRLSKHHQPNTRYGAIEQELERMGVQDPGIRDVAAAVIHIRRSKLPDPAQTGNAGSFFKNPVIPQEQFETLQQQYPQISGYPSPNNSIKLSAGWLIEQCGWKGYREGDAGCHAQQALVLVNHGMATGSEILNLANKISASVQEKFGVVLEKEVNLI